MPKKDTRTSARELSRDPAGAAVAVGLHYVSDDSPGITRKAAGRGFWYLDAQRNKIGDPATLSRIKSLKVPPAWEDVWICPRPNGHIQATGRDAKGRKQYVYHPDWNEVRDGCKFHRMLEFGEALPSIRARVEQDMSRRGLSRERVLATVVRLLETTLIRVGNDEYARNNGSYGLTTMQDGHAEVNTSSVEFRFRGKRGIERTVALRDRRLARIVKQCQELPGQELFQYCDEDGTVRDITSGDVNEYLREIAGSDFTAKDFRTWAGTLLAAMALQEFEAFESHTAAKRNITQAIKRVARRLGNTPAICRKSYIHPAVLDSYLDGSLIETLSRRVEDEIEEGAKGLGADEAAILRLLQRRLVDEKEHVAARRKNAA